jgi:hypothetical protein
MVLLAMAIAPIMQKINDNSKPSYRAKHYESMHVYLASPNGFGVCFESAQIFNVPNSFDDFSFFLLPKMGYY